MSKPSQELKFEESLARLETILEKMNTGQVSLDESLTLFEEADRLIRGCQTKLQAAEQKIEKLMKNREGELVLDETGSPRKEKFSSEEQGK